MEMGIFNALTQFLQPLYILWCSKILFCTSELYSYVFLIVMDDHIYNPVEQ